MNKLYFTISILILFSSLLIARAFGQLVQLPNIELITEKDGLPFNISTCITQDKQGFIWIGGTDGIARYDGYSFVTVQLKPGMMNSLPNNSVASIKVDHNGIIWAGHVGGYVSKLDPKTFSVWYTKIEGADETTVTNIFCDSKGIIWCAVFGLGLYRFDGKDSFHHICSLSDLPQDGVTPSIHYNVITDFYEDDDYNLWLSSFNGLYKYSSRDSSLYHIPLGNSKDPISINQLLYDAQGGLWCATTGGLIYYDFKLKKNQRYIYPKDNQRAVYSIVPSNKNEIWLGTVKGILVFDKGSKRYSSFSESGEPNTIFDCGRMIVGRLGIIWVVSSKGLFKWNPTENHFKFHKLNAAPANDYFVTGVLNDQKNKRLVVGTIYADGLHVIDSIGKEMTFSIPVLPQGEPYNIVNDLIQNKAGDIYVLMRDYLLLLTPDNKLKKIDAINSLLPKSTIPFFYKMIQSENGDLWVVSSRNGLFHFNSKINKWDYIATPSPYPLVDNKVHKILEDKNHRIWLMHSRIGLTVYDQLKKNWTSYKHESGKHGTLISNLLTDMTITPKGEIFVTSFEGISKFNPKNNSFENHNISTGLPTDAFYSLADDDNGSLWTSTNKGVLRIDPATWETQLFSFKDGLTGLYGYYTLCRGNQGKMYIGTLKGFYAFEPVEIKNSEFRKVPVTISSIKNLSTTKVEYSPSDKFLVDYENNSIAIEFVALNFSNSLKNKYRYRMESLDQDWIETTDHSVNYSGIPSGSYSFQVQLVGSDSKSSEGSIKILVSTPFWKQDWFRMLLATTGLSIVYFIYRVRLNQVRKEERLKREYNQKLAEVEMKALKAQMNPHFIFNSLNSINRYIVKSEPEKASLYLTKFSKLIRLILDNSNQKIISLENELNALKLYIELEVLRFNEKFNYTIYVDDELNPFSIGIPPMIIQPFVENAIWHGLLHKEGSGKLEIQIERYGTGLKCIISDNGVGRKKALELKSKSINNAKSYGMKITNDRLTMLNGESKLSTVEIIDLEDDKGNALGTKVIVKILSAELEPEF